MHDLHVLLLTVDVYLKSIAGHGRWALLLNGLGCL